MNIQASIEQKLNQEYRPSYQLIENESHLHGGGAGESHFKLTVVSESFVGPESREATSERICATGR